VTNLRIHGYHGVAKAEKSLGRKFYMDIDCHVARAAAADDTMDSTVPERCVRPDSVVVRAPSLGMNCGNLRDAHAGRATSRGDGGHAIVSPDRTAPRNAHLDCETQNIGHGEYSQARPPTQGPRNEGAAGFATAPFDSNQ
jgi:hypothetical protein